MIFLMDLAICSSENLLQTKAVLSAHFQSKSVSG